MIWQNKMTIRESISQVKEPLKEVNADSRLTNKFIYNKLLTKAFLFIQRESDALRLAYIKEMYQTLKCLKIEEAPAIDPCCGIKSKAVVYRSVNKLPEMYVDSRGDIIDSVESLDGFTSIKLTTPASVRRYMEDTNSKFDKTVYGFIFNEYLYLLKKHPVKITAAFVSEVSDYCACEDKPCVRFLDFKWRVPKKILDQAILAVTEDLIKSYKQIKLDGDINKKEG